MEKLEGVLKMEQEIIVLFARPYAFKNEQGQELKGVTVFYVTKSSTNSEKEGFGLQPVKVSLENANDLKNIPGKYNAIFTAHPSSRGMQLKLSALEFIEKVELWTTPAK